MCIGANAIAQSEATGNEEVTSALAAISKIAEGVSPGNKAEFAEALDLFASEVMLNAYEVETGDTGE